MQNKIIFHIDVNSAFLSWEAAYRLQHGESLDIRDMVSVVGGNQDSRHGIVLAKSISAKKLYNVKTGEPLASVRQRAPNLVVVPPRYDVYTKASDALIELLKEYSPKVEKFSIDEAFLDYTGLQMVFGEPEKAALDIKERIKRELGFTVNIGVSSNKLLAKMAGELEKPDKMNTLWPHEISKKMWGLPVGELYMVGRRVEKRLHNRGIYTIGALAKCDSRLLEAWFKSYGLLLKNFANGIYFEGDIGGAAFFQSMTEKDEKIGIKSVGNSHTFAFDIKTDEKAHTAILAICETVATRLRLHGLKADIVKVSYRNNDLMNTERRRKFHSFTCSTDCIYKRAVEIFDEIWTGIPIRQIRVCVSGIVKEDSVQSSMFDINYKKEKADVVVDELRQRYGFSIISRAGIIESEFNEILGGRFGSGTIRSVTDRL